MFFFTLKNLPTLKWDAQKMLNLLVVFVLWTLGQQKAVIKSEARNMLGPPFGFCFMDFGPAKGCYQIGGPKDALYFLFCLGQKMVVTK